MHLGQIKSLLMISDYDGGEVYLFDYKKKIFQKISELSKIKLNKPHMTNINGDNYYIIEIVNQNDSETTYRGIKSQEKGEANQVEEE